MTHIMFDRLKNYVDWRTFKQATLLILKIVYFKQYW